jgi:predicted amidophosphoribosyltransferase
MKILNKKIILDFFFPKYCLSCYKLNNNYLCFTCLKKINFIGEIKNYNINNIDKLIAVSSLQDATINKLIKAYTKQGIKEISSILVELLRLLWQGRNINSNINYFLLPCPQNKFDTKRCGYDANLEIAKKFAQQFDYNLLINKNKHEMTKENVMIITACFRKTKKIEKLINSLALNKNEVTILAISCDLK